MSDSIDESVPTTKTFCFASGQLLTLKEDQIEKVPYLTAIVSSGDNFESARNEHGHYILDPHIEFKHFAYVLDSLSFHSIRQIFTHLPKKNDIIPIIALFDFLGLITQPDPDLEEVDSIFFSNLVYSPMLEKYLQIVRPSVIQDMAVRFAIAMVKEEYDFSNRQMIDQIYWFIMFILSAYKLFGARLRHHVFKIAEYCFSLFEPSLLKPLKKLIRRTEKDTRKFSTTNDDDVSSDKENKRPLEQVLDIRHQCYDYDWFSFRGSPSLQQRQELLLDRIYSYSDADSDYFWGWSQPAPSEEKLLEPVHKRVLEIMYERLQSEKCRRALAEICKPSGNFIRKTINEWAKPVISNNRFPTDRTYESIYLPKLSSCKHNFSHKEIDEWILHDIFKHEFVQKELNLRECILEEMPGLISNLEKRHRQLVEEIQKYDHNQISQSDWWFNFRIYGPRSRSFEYIQEEALSHELLLNKLHQYSIVVEQIHQHVLEQLCRVARQQINERVHTELEISELRQTLSSCRKLEVLEELKELKELKKPSFQISKAVRQRYPIPAKKPLLKLQFKHSMR